MSWVMVLGIESIIPYLNQEQSQNLYKVKLYNKKIGSAKKTRSNRK